MVKEHVEKTMKKAVKTYAEKLGVKKSDIAFFIHTKPTEEAPELLPKYFYTVNGIPAKKIQIYFVNNVTSMKVNNLFY